MTSALNTGNTAWMLTAAALVLLMIPGLAFFYGGMVRQKSVLNMLMMVMGALFIVAVLWTLYGYGMAFGTPADGWPEGTTSLIGSVGDSVGLGNQISPDLFLAPNDDPNVFGAGVPLIVFIAFQAMFACITVGLIAGAIADRAKFSAWLVFAAVWATLVYFPVAHWVWDATGWIFQKGVIDYAGGTAVHINAGAAALALAIVLGRRLGWPKTPMKPHNLTLVMIGAGLLWFGWFGFNAGSGLAAGTADSVVFYNTFVATCTAAIGWLVVEKIRDGHATSLGAASGIVAGLVAITPSCSAVNPVGAMILGAIAGVVCALAVGLKYVFKVDDSLDVVGVHLVGGLVGTLLIGFLATSAAPAGVDGIFYGGGAEQLGKQAIGAFAVLGYSLVMALIIGFAIKYTMGFRVKEDDEVSGVDLAEHAETAYELGDSGGGGVFAGIGHHHSQEG